MDKLHAMDTLVASNIKEIRVKNGDAPLTSVEVENVVKQMETPYSQCSIKLELRVDGLFDKVRIFFIVGLLQHIITMKLFKVFHEHVCNFADNFVAFTWYYGKWHQFYDYFLFHEKEFEEEERKFKEQESRVPINGPILNAQSPKKKKNKKNKKKKENNEPPKTNKREPPVKKKWRYATFDVQNKDNRATIILLVLYFSVNMLYFAQHINLGDFNSDYIRIFFAWVLAHTTTHTVEWFHFVWKIVVGTLFSGDYNTSHFNTWSMQLMIRAYKVWLYEKGWCDAEIFEKDCSYCRFGAQGDNGLMGSREDYWDKINIHTFADFLRENYHHVLKDVKEYDHFYTEFDEFGNIVKEGPFFLQRYFTPAGPCRPTSVYEKKILGSTQFLSPQLIASKTIGLAYDTYGTNPYAYNMLKSIYESNRLLMPVTVAENLVADVKSSRKRKYVWGIEEQHILPGFPSIEWIRHLMNTASPSENSLYHSDHIERTFESLHCKGIY
jgi:hypothetical protein